MNNFDFNSLMNYGALGACLCYFIYKDNTTMKDLRDTVQGLKETVIMLKENVMNKEDK